LEPIPAQLARLKRSGAATTGVGTAATAVGTTATGVGAAATGVGAAATGVGAAATGLGATATGVGTATTAGIGAIPRVLGPSTAVLGDSSPVLGTRTQVLGEKSPVLDSARSLWNHVTPIGDLGLEAHPQHLLLPANGIGVSRPLETAHRFTAPRCAWGPSGTRLALQGRRQRRSSLSERPRRVSQEDR
jgi:hypothetical protein